jgi:SAM-dependent methyltransferase
MELPPTGRISGVGASRIVEDGYNQMAEQYLASKRRDDPVALAALDQLARYVPDGGHVLDLGCGAGVPATKWLAQRFSVTGADLSARQVALARREVPRATIIQADMTSLGLPEASFDAVVAFYSIIHVPRSAQPALLRRIGRWLKPGGGFLATWAIQTWEGQEENWQGWGAPMWWSHHDEATNLAMLRDAGFIIETADRRTSSGETWLWVLARTPTLGEERPISGHQSATLSAQWSGQGADAPQQETHRQAHRQGDERMLCKHPVWDMASMDLCAATCAHRMAYAGYTSALGSQVNRTCQARKANIQVPPAHFW